MKTRWVIQIGIVCASIALAGMLNEQLLAMRTARHLTQAPPTVNMPPSVAFITVALGGFRGILADILWMRAGRMQEEGRYFELVQLSDWISKLQPRSTAIWSYHAWNMAYNVSAVLADPAEKWHWVRNGIGLLRDEGMVVNPGSARLHQELSWMFLHKLGSDDDSQGAFYREQWAAEMAASGTGLDPLLVVKIESELAPLDWHTPQAHAIYWAMAGLPFVRTSFEQLSLRRNIYQALLQRIALGERQYIPVTTAFVAETQRLYPDVGALQELLQRLRALDRTPN